MKLTKLMATAVMVMISSTLYLDMGTVKADILDSNCKKAIETVKAKVQDPKLLKSLTKIEKNLAEYDSEANRISREIQEYGYEPVQRYNHNQALFAARDIYEQLEISKADRTTIGSVCNTYKAI